MESILRLPSPSAAGGWVSEPHLNRRRWFTLPPRSPTLIPHPRAPLPVIKDKTCASLHSPFQIQPLHFIELLSTQQAQIQSIVQFSHHQQRRVDFNNPFLFTGFPDQLSGFHSLEKDWWWDCPYINIWEVLGNPSPQPSRFPSTFNICEAQPPASIGWVALSPLPVRSFVRSFVVNTSSHLHYMMF